MIMTSNNDYDAEARTKKRKHEAYENWTCGQGKDIAITRIDYLFI